MLSRHLSFRLETGVQTDEIASRVFRTIENAQCYDQKGMLSRKKADSGSALSLGEMYDSAGTRASGDEYFAFDPHTG